MNDDNIIISQSAERSQNVTQIGYQQITNVYGGDAQAIHDYLLSIVNDPDLNDLEERYIDLAAMQAIPPGQGKRKMIRPALRMYLEQQAEPQPVDSVREAMRSEKRLVLLGEPGAGKTTALRILYLDAARRCLEDVTQHPLPVFLDMGNPTIPDNILDYANEVLLRHSIRDIPLARTLLLLLDGLDEIPVENLEARALSIVTLLKDKVYRSVQMVATCREKDYGGLLELSISRIILQPLDDARVRTFLNVHLEHGQSVELMNRFQPESEIQKERALLELARNPYLLIILVEFFDRYGNLPNNRAELFKALMDIRWEDEYAGGATSGLEREVFNNALGSLAFYMIKDEEQGNSISIEMAKNHLQRIVGLSVNKIFDVGSACNILAVSDREIRFYHQLIQEFFAAQTLDWRTDLTAFVQEYHLWRETLFMLAGTNDMAYEAVTSAFRSALADSSAHMRQVAAEALDTLDWQPSDKQEQVIYLIGKQQWDDCIEIGEPAVKLLIKTLRDSQSSVREAAAATLGKIGSTQAVEPLLDVLRDSDSRVHQAAGTALGLIGRPAVNLLFEIQWRLRHATIATLKQIGDPWAVDKLEEALADTDSTVRQTAAEALGELDSVQSIKPLVKALRDNNSTVRQAAAEALDALSWQFDDEQEKVAYLIAKQQWDDCAAVGVPAVSKLIEILYDSDFSVLQAAATVLRQIGIPSVESMIEILHDQDPNVCWIAAKTLGQIGDTRATIPLLEVVLDDLQDSGVRHAAALALGQMGSKETIEPLTVVLGDEKWQVRQAVAEALDMLGWRPNNEQEKVAYLIAKQQWNECVAIGEPAVESLIKFSNDEAGSVRQASTVALARIGDARAISILNKALNGPDSYLGYAVAEALREFAMQASRQI